MQIIKYGTKIKTTIGNIEAIVTGCCIRNENISYEISYFQNGQHTSIWVQSIEIYIDNSESKKAGLVNYENENNTKLWIK